MRQATGKTIAELMDEEGAGKLTQHADAIGGVIPRGLTVLYAPTKVGKTFLAIHTALCVCRGSGWPDRPIEAGSVLYVASEAVWEVQRRVIIAARVAGLSMEDAGLFTVAGLVGTIHDKDFRSQVNMEIAKASTAAPIRLIVLDTLGAAFGDKSQDDAGPMSGALDKLRDIAAGHGCSVMVVHHTGKDGKGARGSQVLLDRADSVLKIKDGRSGSELVVEYLRNGPAGSRFAFNRIERDGSCVIDGLNEIGTEKAKLPQPVKTGTWAEIAHRAIQKCQIGQSDVTEANWKNEFRAIVASENRVINRQSFSDGKKALIGKGLVKMSGLNFRLSETSETSQIYPISDAA